MCINRSVFVLCLLWPAATIAQQVTVTDTARTHQLNEVKVTAQKGAIENSPGKTTVNVQALTGTTGKTLMDVLRRLPGVSVDGQGNISMNGRQGVQVMINGRPAWLQGDELREYLQSMTAEEVAQIEIMSQPPARYDAEGNAGILNLKLRKLRRHGINGNINTGWTKSLYESTHNTALLNYNTGKTNWYTSANYINGRNGVHWTQDFVYKDAAGTPTVTQQVTAHPEEMFDKYNLRAGVDHTFNSHNSGGAMATVAYYANQMTSPIEQTTNLPGGRTNYSLRQTDEHSLRRNATANAWWKHTLATNATLDVNADYLYNGKNLYQVLETSAWQNNQPLPNQLILRSRVPVNVEVGSIRADYTATVRNTKLEAGARYSNTNIDNAPDFEINTASQWLADPSRSNQFLYHEQLGAAYASATRKHNDHWAVQAGLRAEYAAINGVQTATGQQFSRRLPALFPTLFVSHDADSNHHWELNAGRRVERPHYSMLNPFNYYTFYNSWQRGNPQLLPQYSYNAELKHVYKNRITTAASVNHVANEMTWIQVADPVAQTTYGTYTNFAGSTVGMLGITVSAKPRTWCEMTLHSAATYALYHGMMNGEPVSREGAAWLVWANSQLVLGRGYTADCYISYNSPKVASALGTDSGTLYSNAGVSKKVFHDTTTIRMAVDDPFFIYRNRSQTNQANLSSQSLFVSNSRYCTMSVSYNFGQTSARTRRNERLPDEAKRM